MPALIRARVRPATQPRFAAGPDRTAPWARGLRRLVLSTHDVVDLAEGAALTRLANGTIESPLRGGTAFGGALGRYLNQAQTNGGTARVASWTNVTSQASALLVMQRESAGGNEGWWELGSSSVDHFPFASAAYSDAFWSSRWMNGVAAPSGATFSDPVVLIVTVRDGEQIAYWNGRPWHSNTLTGGFTLPAQLILYRNDYGESPTTYYAAAAWDRVLTPAEAYALGENPWRLFAPTRRIYSIEFAGGGDVSVSLTGQSATANAGTIGPQTSKALSGQAATSAAGTVAPSASKALSGQAATSAAGTIAPSTTKALTGEAATTAQGSVTTGSDVTAALTGQAATASAGSVAPSTSKALSGEAGTSAAGTVAPSSAKALSGQAATASAGTVAPSTTIGLTGQAATAAAGTVTTGSDKTAALSGQAATAAAGSVGLAVTVALSGQAATASAGTVAPSAAKALSGQAATSAAGTVAPSSSVGLTGQSATTGQGTVTAPGNVTVSLTGIGATATAGSLGLHLGIAVSGRSATASAGSLGVARAVSLSGQAATAAAGAIATSGGESAAPLDEPLFRQRIRVAAKRIDGKPVPGTGRIGGPIQ